MKNKYAAIALGLILTLSSFPVYAAENTTETTSSAEENGNAAETEENTLLGQVTAVNEDSFTIALGTRKEMQAPGGEGGEQQTPPDGEDGGQQTPPDGEDGGQPSMLDLTGEEQTISVTSDTIITRQSMQAPGGEGDEQQTPPEKPEKASEDNGTAPVSDENAESPDDDTSEPVTLSDLQEGDIVAVELNDDGTAASVIIQSMNMGGGMGGPGSQSQGVDSYTTVNTYSEDTSLDGDSIASSGTDENAILIDSGASVSIKNATITRNSEESTGGDDSSFYGVGAAVLTTDGTASVSNSTITTDAKGGAGLFAYGDGTIYAADSTITTQQDTSGGIHAAGGGTLYAWDLDVTTSGQSSAAIRSDRGGGTMVVDGGTYTSNGVGSPAVYCTADIAVNNATLTANGSEAVCIEGLNSLHLFNCALSGNMDDDDQNDCTWGVIVYQSMSGDSEVGNSTFQMTGGTLKTGNGGLLYTTNTECTLTLDSVDITYAPDSEFFLRCTGNDNQRGWGQTGSNGSDCLFTAINQEMQGDVIWDSISDLDFYITDNSVLTGAFVDDETYAGNGGNGYCNVYLEEGCTWTVSGDSTVTSLESEGDIVDTDGKTVSIIGTDGTVYVEGDSAYTITTGSYHDSVDLGGATAEASWSDYETERPETL